MLNIWLSRSEVVASKRQTEKEMGVSVCDTLPSEVLHRSRCALNCPTGARHNKLRDFTAEILLEVCADVCTKPPLQPLFGETLAYATANVEDGACY